jgi:hypothetical protein
MSADSQSEDDLRQAIAISPEFGPPYALLAVYMATHNEDLPEALSFAQKAVSFEPGNSTYQLALAQVLARMEKYDEAKAAAMQSAAWAHQPQDRANAESFLNYLQQLKSFHAASAAAGADEGFAYTNEPRERDEGIVANASCEPALKIDLNTAGVIVHLHSAADHPVPISVEGKPTAGLNPCTSLKGLRVSVLYRPDEKDANSGELRALSILTTTDQAAKLPPGTAIVEGKVADVTCDDNDMQLRLTVAPDKLLILHASDYTKINYLAGANSSLGDLEPCSEMKGRSVKITYAETQQKKFAGEMQTIVVGK